jgi:Glycoside hydrolase family 44
MRSAVPLVTAGLAAALVALGAAPSTSSQVRPVASKTGVSKTRVSLTVDAAKGRHAISPLIYGVNFASQVPGLGKAFRVPVDRWGGNSTSRYNYTNHTYNTGSDYYFENIVASGKGTLGSLVKTDRKRHSSSLVTVPMIGWVSKKSPRRHPFSCSFPRTRFPSQQSFDPYDSNCGNGVDGSKSLKADPRTTSKRAGPAFDKRMVRHLVSTYGRAARRGVRLYELDNEPDLWNSTHRDVHPQPLSEKELWKKSKATAEAVKQADPTAGVLGPSDWGWCAYYYSAVDDCGSSTKDQDAHGGLPLGQWYLKQFAHAQRTTGTRLLDYFDEHFYPQESGVALSPAGDAATEALRLRSTRALWDPRYVDESWISQANGGKPLAWIRTMRAWVKKYYPGTKTAISEYNWGALDSMNGALAQADVLGIFGRERLGLATLWGPTKATDPWAYAFRMYRNYDGHGATFGDTSVRAVSSNQGRLAVYAATRGSDGALTMMVVNKSGSSIRSPIALRHFAAGPKARVFRYSAAHLHKIVRGAAIAVHHRRLTTTYPASSITLLVLPRR